MLPRFQFNCPFIFLLFVASKGWWLEAEVALSIFSRFIGFNLLIWSYYSVRELKQEVRLITYDETVNYLKIMKNNKMTIKRRM